MKRLLLLAFLLVPLFSFAAETCIVTQTAYYNLKTDFRRVTFTVVMDTDGSFDAANTVDGCVFTSNNNMFIVHQATVNPGATAPTDEYVAILIDSSGADIMGGSALDTTASEFLKPKTIEGTEWHMFISDTLTLNQITGNSVASATTVIDVYLQRVE